MPWVVLLICVLVYCCCVYIYIYGDSGGEILTSHREPPVSTRVDEENHRKQGATWSRTECYDRTVHFSGYDLHLVAKAVLPELVEGASQNNCSVLLIGMHGTISGNLDEFPGIVVYLNGEVEAHSISQRHYYLGPPSQNIPQGRSLQFFYVSYAFLVLGKPSFDITREEQRPNFLLYISSRCLGHREFAFDAFSTIGEVHAAGNCNGKTTNFKKVDIDQNAGWAGTSSAYKEYKFALAMENTMHHGYVTEKILNAFIGGAVPIYWGTKDVYDIFNREAFIYFDPDNPQSALDRVKYLESNATAYAEIRQHPKLAKNALQNVFSLSDDIGNGVLKNRIRSFLGIENS
jgi:hypothetical protein